MGCGAGKQKNGNGKIHSKQGAEPLPPMVQATPCGHFESTSAGSDEGRRDFARIFFANERKIFAMFGDFQGPKPIQVTAQPSSTHVGDLSSTVVEKAALIFAERLGAVFESAAIMKPPNLEDLVDQIMAQTTVNVGIDFASQMALVPMFLQPVFVVMGLGEPLQVRVLTYGFFAEKPQQVVGDRPDSKRSPFVVRLCSPVVGSSQASPGGKVTISYRAWPVQAATTGQVVSDDAEMLRKAISMGSWEPLDIKATE